MHCIAVLMLLQYSYTMRYKRAEISVILRYMACIVIPLYRENVQQIPGIIAADNARIKFDITNKLYLSIGQLYKYYCMQLCILLFSEICAISDLKGVFSDFYKSGIFILPIPLKRHTVHLLLFDIYLSFYDILLLLFDILTLIIL